MKINEILTELRKNPEQNPKTSINYSINKRLWKSPYGKTIDIPNLFVSFTQLDKLGVNPNIRFKTPVGIYSYPAQYVMKRVGPNRPMSDLPFAGDSEYANLFEVDGNIVDLQRITLSDLKGYVHQIEQILKASGSNIDLTSIQREAWQTDKFRIPGSVFWTITKTVALPLGEEWGMKQPAAWTRLFRMMGIDGALDSNRMSEGVGIIHPAEPTQMVVFDPTVIKNVERYYNKYSPHLQATSRKKGEIADRNARVLFQKYQSMTPEQIVHWFTDGEGSKTPSEIKYVKNRKLRTQILQKNPNIFFSMQNPSESEQLAFVQSAPHNVSKEYIDVFSDRVLIYALQHGIFTPNDIEVHHDNISHPLMKAMTR